MEWVEGLTLTQVLAARGLLGGQEAALIGIDVCRAVAAVHKAGLLHRDIKAHNVMREAGGRIVLMDFGAGEIRTEHSLAEPRLIGTPLYLAPEILRRSARHHRQRHLQPRRAAVSPHDHAVSRRRRDVRRHRRDACAPATDTAVRSPARSAAASCAGRRRRAGARSGTPVSRRRR